MTHLYPKCLNYLAKRRKNSKAEEESLLGSKQQKRKRKENWTDKLRRKRDKEPKAVGELLRSQNNLLMWTVFSEDAEERRRRLFGLETV